MNAKRPHLAVTPDPAIEAVRAEVVARLRAVERERDLRIVYACESGSRAWGFASTNSDFDVRFIFVRPAREYLRLVPPVDAFDLHDASSDFDLAGWDIRKTCELMRRSNPPLLEWLDSPIVYLADDDLSRRLIALRERYFDAKKAAYHYLSLARGVWSKYIEHAEHPVRKKYLYVLRPLACIRFIDLHRAMPPTAFDAVLAGIDWPGDARSAVDELVAAKKSGAELSRTKPDDTLSRYIPRWLDEAESAAAGLPVNETPTEALDALIEYAVLGEKGGIVSRRAAEGAEN